MSDCSNSVRPYQVVELHPESFEKASKAFKAWADLLVAAIEAKAMLSGQVSLTPPRPADAGFTVADLCRRWRVGPDKVHRWLESGELVGVNLATNTTDKQWRIVPEEVEKFERRRSSTPPPKPTKRKKRMEEVDYFPD
jgi:hypothetical protein